MAMTNAQAALLAAAQVWTASAAAVKTPVSRDSVEMVARSFKLFLDRVDAEDERTRTVEQKGTLEQRVERIESNLASASEGVR